MNSAQFEVRVQSLVERILDGGRGEDELFEVKSEWPSPSAAAPVVAAMCNAASGRPVVLVVGLDEKRHAFTPPKTPEKSAWFQQFATEFDDKVAPDLLRDLVVRVRDGHVDALLFDAQRAPYVIRDTNAGCGRVPYRVGTRIEWSRRQHLLRVLSSQVELPFIELVSASTRALGHQNNEYSVRLYVMPTTSGSVNLASHRTTLTLHDIVGTTRSELRRVTGGGAYNLEGQSPSSALTFQGARLVTYAGTLPPMQPRGDIELTISVMLAGTDAVVKANALLRRHQHDMFMYDQLADS